MMASAISGSGSSSPNPSIMTTAFVGAARRSGRDRCSRARRRSGTRTSLPSMRPSRIAPTGPKNGTRASSSAAEAPIIDEHVGIVLAVGRDRAGLDLDLVAVPLGKERPDRPVDQPRREDFLGGRPPLALDEAAGELAGGIRLFAVVDGQAGRNRALRGPGRPRRRPASSCRRCGRPRHRWLAWREDPSRCSTACRRRSARQACGKLQCAGHGLYLRCRAVAAAW